MFPDLEEQLDQSYPQFIRLDLTSEVFAPIKLNNLEIGPHELVELSLKIDFHRESTPIRLLGSKTEQLLLNIASNLREANLFPFTREIATDGIFSKDQKLIKLTEETFGSGNFRTLAEQLERIPDYDVRILLNNQEYLREVAKGIRLRNFAFCKDYLPHYISASGIPLVNRLADQLENNDLRQAIALRLNEGDKLRNRGQLTEYIKRIFGTGFRLLKDFSGNTENLQE